MPIIEEKQVFLIQCNGKQASHKYHGDFHDRTYADEMNKYLYYRNDTWSKEDRRDRDFGEVNTGDTIIQYCTSNVKSSPSQIKNIFKVERIEYIEEDNSYPHVIRLKLEMSLKSGCGYSSVRQLVANGRFSPKMKNCGQRGFNICKVKLEDYRVLLAWDIE